MVHSSSKSSSPARLRDPETGRFISSPQSNRSHSGRLAKPGRHPSSGLSNYSHHGGKNVTACTLAKRQAVSPSKKRETTSGAHHIHHGSLPKGMSACALAKRQAVSPSKANHHHHHKKGMSACAIAKKHATGTHHTGSHHASSGCSPCKEKLLAFMNYESPEDIRAALLKDVSYFDKYGNRINIHHGGKAHSAPHSKSHSSHSAPHSKSHSSHSTPHSKNGYSHGLPAARRSPSKHVSPSSTPLNCTTWAGCVYSSMAQHAASKGMKLQHGIDDMHKLLHTAKEEYPHIYAALRKDGNAWKSNPELVARVEELYVPKVGSY